jgi:hypothetical protein
MMNNISDVTSDKVQVMQVPGGVELRVQYEVKIGLVANMSLLLEFDTSSSHPK